jgi:hypothetical protein
LLGLVAILFACRVFYFASSLFCERVVSISSLEAYYKRKRLLQISLQKSSKYGIPKIEGSLHFFEECGGFLSSHLKFKVEFWPVEEHNSTGKYYIIVVLVAKPGVTL